MWQSAVAAVAQGPEDERSEDESLARKAVAEPSCEGAEDGIHPHKRGADDAELNVREVELLLDEGEDGEDSLAVRVVEEADEPEHGDDQPLVGRAQVAWVGSRHGWLGWSNRSGVEGRCQLQPIAAGTACL